MSDTATPYDSSLVEDFMHGVVERNPAETEFHQAVREFAESVAPYTQSRPQYREGHILDRMTEPDRIVIFRVCWENDLHQVCCNRGWRVQFSNAIGPYKGGLRFHPGVTQSVLKFLGFEQVFKNALTGLPMGGGVAVSGLEQSQNSIRSAWQRDEVDARLKSIMHGIHEQCVHFGLQADGSVDYVRGANIGGFAKVADAMLAYGIG